jgi:hypothetical protein
MKRFLPLPVFALLILLIGVLMVACGDDDEGDGGGEDTAAATDGGGGATSLGAYLREVNDVQEGVSAATDDIGEDSQQAFSDPARARQAMSAAIDVAESAVTALEAIDPPEEASTAHANLIAAGENLVDVATALSAELQGMSAGAEFDAFAEEAQAEGSDLSNAIDEMVTACEALQIISEENKTSVDLACPNPDA